jgi:hypothetical protein
MARDGRGEPRSLYNSVTDQVGAGAFACAAAGGFGRGSDRTELTLGWADEGVCPTQSLPDRTSMKVRT